MMKQSRKYAPDPETLALRAELQAAQSELALAYRQFDQATAPELVESCIYRRFSPSATPVTALGFLALWAVNATAAVTGVALGLNLLNALTVGVLGLPGFVLLLLAQWVL